MMTTDILFGQTNSNEKEASIIEPDMPDYLVDDVVIANIAGERWMTKIVSAKYMAQKNANGNVVKANWIYTLELGGRQKTVYAKDIVTKVQLEGVAVTARQ